MNNSGLRRGRVFFYGLFVFLTLFVLYILRPYIGVILIAFVTVILLHPLYEYFLARKRVKNRSNVATTLTLVSFFLVIIIPLFIIGFLLYSQGSDLLKSISSSDFELSLSNLVAKLEEFFQGIPRLSEIEIDQEKIAEALISLGTAFLSWLTDLAVSLGTTLPALFIGGIIFLVVLATLLSRLTDLNDRAQELSPLDVNITQIYLLKGQEMIISVVKGVFLLAVIQGLIMGVFYWLAGVPFAVFFTLLSMAFAILPVVGISFIVLPMALIFILLGNITSAVIVLVGFYVLVNPTDLILRPRLVSKEAYLNFTLMLLALFGGLAAGGLIGMIYGPVIMILFITTIEIYAQYFADNGDQQVDNPALLEDPVILPESVTVNSDGVIDDGVINDGVIDDGVIDDGAAS
jgi:predicted PurR-regulated permease PerM